VKRTLFRNGLILTQDPARKILRGSVLVDGDRIEEVGQVRSSWDEIIDCTDKIIMPGLFNTHCHVAMSHLKGKLDDISLSTFLERTFKLDGERTEKGIYNSTRLGTLEMLSAGITSFVDLYYSEDIIARSAKESGIRGFLAWNTLDQDKTTQKGDTVSNAERFITEFSRGGLITPGIGVQGVYVAGDEIFSRAKEVARKHRTFSHIHLAETREEVYGFLKGDARERPIEHLFRIGFLGPEVLAAHCVWANSSEIRYLARSGTKVSWNPVSNSKLAVGGIAPVPEMLESGVNLSIGTDSSGSNNSLDIIQSMKFGAIQIKNQRWDPRKANAQAVLDMATINGPMALGRSDLGSLETGKTADIITISLKNPRMWPTDANNAVQNIVYSADSSCVMEVMVGGVLRKEGGIMKDDFYAEPDSLV
jgi:5-methylthioadenosine/S-adenosylhomocysteine deaminase